LQQPLAAQEGAPEVPGVRSLAYLMAAAIVEMVVGETAANLRFDAILTARLEWLVANVIRTIGS